MKYSYEITAPVSEVYKTLVAEQLKYYRQFNPQLKKLQPGIKIDTKLPTKLNKLPVSAQIKITEIKPSDKFVQETSSSNGVIQQTYRFEKKDDSNVLVYEEKNHFNGAMAQSSYGIVGLFYHFVFNKRAKKRAKYLDMRAQGLVDNL